MIDKVDPNSGAVTAYVGDGTFNNSGGSPLLSAGIYGSLNLAFGPDGNLYTVDQFSNSIWKITSDSAISVLPPGGPASSTLFMPAGIVFDALGNFFVMANKQVKMVSPNGSVIDPGRARGFREWDNGPAASASFLYPSALQRDPSGNLYMRRYQDPTA